MPREIDHCDGRDQLELRRVVGHGLGVWLDLLSDLGKLVVGDHFAVDLHPFIEAGDKRRCVKSGAVARRAKNRVEHRGGGAFAVRPGDVDEFQCFLRIAEPL